MIARATLALMLAGPALGGAMLTASHHARADTNRPVAKPPASHPGERFTSRRNRNIGTMAAVRHGTRREAPAADAVSDDGLAYDTPRDSAGRPLPTSASDRDISDVVDHQVLGGGAQIGTASWYGGRAWAGHRMSDGTRYNEDALTAAHASLPLGSQVRVVLADTHRSVVVTITDRPGTRTRIIDLSRGAAAALGMLSRGLAQVRLEPI